MAPRSIPRVRIGDGSEPPQSELMHATISADQHADRLIALAFVLGEDIDQGHDPTGPYVQLYRCRLRNRLQKYLESLPSHPLTRVATQKEM